MVLSRLRTPGSSSTTKILGFGFMRGSFGKFHDEARAAAGLALGPKPAPVGLGDHAGDGEPQARARGAGGEEGAEIFFGLAAQARAVVGDLDPDDARLGPEVHADLAGPGLAGVAEKVDEDLLQALAVHAGRDLAGGH